MLVFGTEYRNGAGTTLTGCNLDFCDALDGVYGCMGSVDCLLGMQRDGSQQEVLCTKEKREKLKSGKMVYPFVGGQYREIVE